ncbi:MAG: hypothetical protein RL226_612, partial [Bacteroidota bacterium]
LYMLQAKDVLRLKKITMMKRKNLDRTMEAKRKGRCLISAIQRYLFKMMS